MLRSGFNLLTMSLLFWYQGTADLKMNCFLLYFLKMWVWCYFFLKHLIQFTSKLSGLDISLGSVLIMNSNSFIDKTLWLFSLIVCPFWSTVICQAVCFHLCCQTDWHEYNTFFLFFCFIIYYFSYFFISEGSVMIQSFLFFIFIIYFLPFSPWSI